MTHGHRRDLPNICQSDDEKRKLKEKGKQKRCTGRDIEIIWGIFYLNTRDSESYI